MRLSHPVASLRVHRSILLYGRQTTCRVDAKRRTARQMSGPGSNLAAEDLPLQRSRPSRRLRRLRRLRKTCGGGHTCGAVRVRLWSSVWLQHNRDTPCVARCGPWLAWRSSVVAWVSDSVSGPVRELWLRPIASDWVPERPR